VAPEDDWDLVANPGVYFDQLPQPFRFINKCLDNLILHPVFEKIVLIEEKKKTPEYEGFLKDVQATGFLELEGVTVVKTISKALAAGGIPESSDEQVPVLPSRTLLGDKFGAIHLLEVNRKLVLDKRVLFEGQRIESIATATIVWADTKLTYAAVIGRGSPEIKILCFKHLENMLYHFYTINMLPGVAYMPEGGYADYPAECVISADCLFMAVTSYGGEVKLVRMPPIFDPLREK